MRISAELPEGLGSAMIARVAVWASAPRRVAAAVRQAEWAAERLSHPDRYGPPVTTRWFEDYPQDSTWEFGPLLVDEAEVIDFGRRFDPQPFHVDPTAAAAGPYGGLIASGWHTCALMMRLFVEQYLSAASSLGSPGVDELRWVLPVRPGDELTVKATVREARRSRSKPDRGLVRTHVELLNQDGDVVLTLLAMNLIRTRPS